MTDHDLNTLVKVSRQLGALRACVEMTIEHLQGKGFISDKSTVIDMLTRALTHDGTESYRLFPEPPQLLWETPSEAVLRAQFAAEGKGAKSADQEGS